MNAALCASGHLIPCWFSPAMFVSVVNLSPQGLLAGVFPWVINQPGHFFTLWNWLSGVCWALLTLPPALHWVKSLSPENLLQLLFLLFPLPLARSRAQGLDPLQASPSPLFWITSGWQIAPAFHSISPGTASFLSSWGFWPFSRCLLQPRGGLGGAVMDSR